MIMVCFRQLLKTRLFAEY